MIILFIVHVYNITTMIWSVNDFRLSDLYLSFYKLFICFRCSFFGAQWTDGKGQQWTGTQRGCNEVQCIYFRPLKVSIDKT